MVILLVSCAAPPALPAAAPGPTQTFTVALTPSSTPGSTWTAIYDPTPIPTLTPLSTQRIADILIVTTDYSGAPSGFFGPSNMGHGDVFPSNRLEYGATLGMWVDLGIDRLTAQNYQEDGGNSWVIIKRNQDKIYQIDTGHTGTGWSLQSFWAYDTHWVLETEKTIRAPADTAYHSFGQLSEDGVLLNEKYGYEEAFSFQTIHSRPFYLFQRDGKVDAWYDGQVIPLGFDEVPHYRCCGSSDLNPRHWQDMIAFFGKRGETWYLVQIGTAESFAP